MRDEACGRKGAMVVGLVTPRTQWMRMQRLPHWLTRTCARRVSSSTSIWHGTQPLPADPILGMTAAFVEDADPRKVNVGQGLYRDDEGLPFVLQSVKEAERRVADALVSGCGDKEYLPIEGHADFRRLSCELVLGQDSAAIADGRVATLQTISGTGALSVAADALRLVAGVDTIYVPDPSWSNHHQILRRAGLTVKTYPYLDHTTGTTLDFGAMRECMASGIPAGSAVLLHACAHNPTGIDPSDAQWRELASLFHERGHHAVFDSAYQAGARLGLRA